MEEKQKNSNSCLNQFPRSFFIINIFLIKKTFQVEIWKMDWTNALSEEN